MKVLTVNTLETASPEIQLDIHFTLKMEQHTDYIFKDNNSSQYSATISMIDTSEVIKKIIECSADLPEYTLVLDDLDMEENKIERYTIQNGKVSEKKVGSWDWDA